MPHRTELRSRVADILPEIVELRHALHCIPETHFQERDTAAAVRHMLATTRLEVLPPLIETDVVALLRGAAPGRCLLLRAELDALPVEEKSGAAWSSSRPGKAHSCGHDGHMAILLGVARVLEGFAGDLSGSVRFVFQPAEEEARGGRALLEKGLLELEPRPDMAFALHGWVGLPVGTLAAAPGAVMAAADRFLIVIRGKGGHAALPHRAVDPIVTAAHAVTALQTVVSRSVDPLEAAVVSVTRIEGGHASNVIPDAVALEGTIRYFDQAQGELLRRRIKGIVAGVCDAGECAHEVKFSDGYAPLVNDAPAVALARAAVTAYLGKDAWAAEHPRTMGAEDFSFYLERVPGALLRLGLGEGWPPLHSAGFDFNDQSLEPGMVALAGLALDFCSP
jgi:amidohydrolase